MADREKVQQIGSIPKENAFPGSKSQRSVSCVNTFREFLTPGIPVHLMVTQATIWGFSGGSNPIFQPATAASISQAFLGQTTIFVGVMSLGNPIFRSQTPFLASQARLPQYFPAKLGQNGDILQAKTFPLN